MKKIKTKCFLSVFSVIKCIFEDKIIIEMNLTEKLYGEQAAKTFECFKTKLNELKKKNNVYFEQNDIDFEEAYIITFDEHHISYKLIINLPEEIKTEIENSFQNCIKEYSKK